ncbi:protein distal antenna-related [Drosophila willistoni]|uniref:protein distal antenna-related n=1 Tax=Drosophila willistoni TaxID=7260 RepID=UPI00017D9372|nr:protein distal antenna-related [Drosophila willistoni]
MDISAYQHMNIRMSTRGKRPLRNLTPNDKVRAIQRIHNGETKASVSRDIGVPESTLRGWCKNEQKLRFMCRQLGPDHMGLDTPPEKRAKFELQLLPPKFPPLPNYNEIGFGSLPFPAIDYTAHNDSLLEKLALLEFMKKNGLHPEAMQQLGDATPAGGASDVVDYSGNGMLNQLNLLTLLNSKLSPESGDASNTTTASGSSSITTTTSTFMPKSESTISMQQLDESKKYNSPLLSVKNWAKDPAKQVPSSHETPPQINDKNNNDMESADIAITTTSSPNLLMESGKLKAFNDEHIISTTFPNHTFPDQAPLVSTNATEDVNGQGQGPSALLDWCKIFNASLNFLAFAAAAASMQPGGGGSGSNFAAPPTLGDESFSLNDALLKRLSPLAHSDASNESYCDSEPEDLSVRSCASKASSPSPANSRSQSPDKSSASSVLHSDGEQ